MLKEGTKNQLFRVFDCFFEIFKNQTGFFEVLRMADQSSAHLTLTHWIFLGKVRPTHHGRVDFPNTHPPQNYYLLHGMNCQKICSRFGGNLIKQFFTSRSGEGISFSIMPSSCFASVYPLNFLQVYMFGRVLGRGACLGSPYSGNDLNLGLHPRLKRTISLQFEVQVPKVPHQR